MSKPIVNYNILITDNEVSFWIMLISFVWLGLSMDAVQVTSGVSKTTNARVSWNILTLFYRSNRNNNNKIFVLKFFHNKRVLILLNRPSLQLYKKYGSDYML